MHNLVAYFAALREIRGNHPLDDGEWVGRWRTAYLAQKRREEVSPHTLMALISPDFQPNYVDPGLFEGAAKGPCEISELVPDTVCPNAAEEGVEFHNDHIWPKKLGGLTDSRNRTVLCAFCNKLKSYNPSFWGWSDPIPEWVSDLLDGIADQIRGTFSSLWK